MYLPRGCGRVRRPERAVQMKSELVGSRLLFCARALRTNGTRLARLSGGVRWGAAWSAIAAAVAVAIAVSDVYRRRHVVVVLLHRTEGSSGEGGGGGS